MKVFKEGDIIPKYFGNVIIKKISKNREFIIWYFESIGIKHKAKLIFNALYCKEKFQIDSYDSVSATSESEVEK